MPPRLGRAASLALIAALIAGCTSQPATAPRATPRSTPAPVDYSGTGTWAKSLNATDCTDFLTKMTGAEQLAVAGYLLQLSRDMTVPDAGSPAAAMVSSFQQGIADLCGEQGGDYPIVAAGTIVYLGDKKYEPPYR